MLPIKNLKTWQGPLCWDGFAGVTLLGRLCWGSFDGATLLWQLYCGSGLDFIFIVDDNNRSFSQHENH